MVIDGYFLPSGVTYYELNNFGYTSYSTNIISSNDFVKSSSQTIQVGSSTQAGLVSASNSYSILKISGGDSGSYSTISINSTTGAISTTSNTAIGTYTLIIRRTGSYFISSYDLTVNAILQSITSDNCCAVIPQGLDYAQILDFKIGNRLIVEQRQNPNKKFDGYSVVSHTL